MTVRNIFIDFGGVIVRTEDKNPRTAQAQALGMTYRELEKIIFESESSAQASIGAIPEEAHWQAVAQALKMPRSQADEVTAQFFAGDRADQALLALLRRARPAHKVCLISNAWSGLRAFITRQGFADVFDEMIISAEVRLAKPDERIFRLALASLGARAEESVFIDDVLANIQGAQAVGMTGLHFTDPAAARQELEHILFDTR